jgi:hypothetical protein
VRGGHWGESDTRNSALAEVGGHFRMGEGGVHWCNKAGQKSALSGVGSHLRMGGERGPFASLP